MKWLCTNLSLVMRLQKRRMAILLHVHKINASYHHPGPQTLTPSLTRGGGGQVKRDTLQQSSPLVDESIAQMFTINTLPGVSRASVCSRWALLFTFRLFVFFTSFHCFSFYLSALSCWWFTLVGTASTFPVIDTTQ